MKSERMLRAFACGAAALLLVACAPKSYAVRDPEPSPVRFVAAEAPTTELSLTDGRVASGPAFLSGTLASTLTLDDAPIDPMAFLSRNVQAELAARGIPVQVGRDGSTFPRLDVKTFRIHNHRTNAYTPYVTFTLISADLETAAGKERLGVFVKRGKVPVWSFDEVVEPTLNEPLSLAVKELSSKIADRLYQAQADDKEVAQLIENVGDSTEDNYRDVYALGFTNNPAVIETLVELTTDEREYVRLAAISSLGTLRASGQFGHLKTIYHDATLWQDRAMALKAIGDLGTPEAKAFLDEQMAHWQAQVDNKEAAWNTMVIGLYM